MNPSRANRFIRSCFKTLLLFILTTVISWVVSQWGVGKESVIMVFLLGVLFTTVLTSGYFFGIITSFASLMALNFLYTEPRFTFVIYSRNDLMLLLFFLLTAMVSGVVTSRLQQQKELAAQNERTADTLYQISSGFLSVSGKENIVRQAIHYVREYAGTDCRVILENDSGSGQCPPADPLKETREYPIQGSAGPLGRICSQKPALETAEQTELIMQAVAAQLGIALESEQLAAEQEQTRMAMESERLRATLLRSVAHDLRSPLTVLLGAGNLLVDEYDQLSDPERKKLARDISEEIVWLTNLVENILDMTRINESQLVIKKELEVIDDVVSEAVAHVDRLLRDRRFTVKLPEEVIMVPMDGRLVVRILINLLENAVHHTLPEAKINLTVTLQDKNLVIAVTDTGEGIDDSIREVLFERFVTRDKVVSDGRRGIGLGLANCKALVEAHGGQIWTEPNKPQGSKFVFTLPIGE